MSAFAILLRRELARYRGLFLAAIAMGLFAALIPAISGASPAVAAERRGATAVGLAALWCLIVGAGLGAASLSRGRGARPLGFDLRLPASTTAIWGARTLAAYLAALGTGALVVGITVPFGADLRLALEVFDAFVHAGLPTSAWFEGILLWSPLLLAVVLLAAQWAEWAIAGSRSLAAIDLVAILIAKGSLWLAFRELLASAALGGVRRLALGALTVGVLVLLAASWRQVARGRDERRTAHRAATPVLLAGALLLAAGGLAFERWYLNPPASASVRDPGSKDLDLGGGWSAVSSHAAGRESRLFFTWLTHETPAREILIDRGASWFYHFDRKLQRAAAAPRVAWIARDDSRGFTLRYLDLDGSDPRPQETGWSWKSFPAWRIADDGGSVEVLPGPKRLALPPRAHPPAGSDPI